LRKKKNDALLEVRNLKAELDGAGRPVRVLDGVDFKLKRGDTLCVVGEEGVGKSTLALALLRLLDYPGEIVNGEVNLDGDDLVELGEEQMRRLRGNRLALIPSDPHEALNPALRLGAQVAEVLQIHRSLPAAQAAGQALELLRRVRLPDPERTVRRYPHQVSRLDAQRVMLAMASACAPDIIVADEPTEGLEEGGRQELLELLKEIRGENAALVLVTRDLRLAAGLASLVLVMYAGRGVELSPARALFADPKFPYTQALIAATPGLAKGDTIPLEGAPAPVDNRLPGCPFAPRCAYRMEQCTAEDPPHIMLEGGRLVRCWLY
jgi:peptide/nickel transport system ATP-binding protein